MSVATTIRDEKPLLISQKDNYGGRFGHVFRSSAIFWVENKSRGFRSTISVSNYWKFKNSLDVAVLANVRSMDGKLVERIPVDFSGSDVWDYIPPPGFEGSVEIEAFSAQNMRIPYAAVMAVYEAEKSVSMVHSYARAYSQHEVEDGRTINRGRESCWTLRETDRWTSFCVVHNGPRRKEAQQALLGMRNAHGEELTYMVDVPELAPFQTLKIQPLQYCPELKSWLAGEPGNGRLAFALEDGFTRMLCGVRAHDNSELQVTHSNFDYSAHQTDFVEGERSEAYMRLPRVPCSRAREVVVYPDASAGECEVTKGGAVMMFRPGASLRICCSAAEQTNLIFRRTDGRMPSRIVTGLRVEPEGDRIPAECSLGVLHHQRPAKHFAWMLVSRAFDSSVCWVDFPEIYGGCPNEAQLVFKLHSAASKRVLEIRRTYGELPTAGILSLEMLFGADVQTHERFDWLSVWCSYGGLMFFSTLSKQGSVTVEHSF